MALTGCIYIVTRKYSCSLYSHNAELWGRVLVTISAQYGGKRHTSVRYWRKIQGSTPYDTEKAVGEWILIMLDGKSRHMTTAKTAVHKHSVQTHMHRILYSAIWAEWNSCQQVPFKALQKFLKKMKICGIFVLLPTIISIAGNILMINKSYMHSHDLQLKSKTVRGSFPPNHGSFHNTCCVV